jgi:transposase
MAIVILWSAMGADDSFPDDVTTLKAMLRAERAARLAAEAEAQARALQIEKLTLTIKKLRHEQFGQSSERGALLDQLELQLADLEENAAQAETAAQVAAAETMTVPSFERRKPARRPLPEHLPRERIVYPVPAICPCFGDSRLRKIGEDVTETLELVPRQWKVIQHVREKLVCRACEAITRPPAPSHPIVRGRCGAEAAGPCPVRQVWPALAAQSSERRLPARRHRPRCINARRLGGRGGGNLDAAGRCNPEPCLCSRAHPRR